jgi:hypothetical protein
MSITTKSHLAGRHSVEQQEELEGIGDMVVARIMASEITKMKQKPIDASDVSDIFQHESQSRAKKKSR